MATVIAINPYEASRFPASGGLPRKSAIRFLALGLTVLTIILGVLWLRAEYELWQYRTTFGPIENYSAQPGELPAR